jgi:hypothetical protein
LRRNCLLKHVIQGRAEVRTEVMGWRGRRRKQLLNALKETKLKEEALDRTVWRTRFGRSYGPVVRQTAGWMNPCAVFFCSSGATAPSGPQPPHYRSFTITFTHTTLGRTPPDKWSARRRDLYLTRHNTHNRQTSMPPAGFEAMIPASERPQTHALDSAAIGVISDSDTYSYHDTVCHMCMDSV